MTPILEFDNVFLKREDTNPTGSAKDRAIPLQVQNLIHHNFKSAVISSTGNAAISAQYYCLKSGIKLTIFVPPDISPAKLKLLPDATIDPQPISAAFRYAKDNHSYNLRQSRDPTALSGYANIGTELLNQLPQATSIFIPVGSGTTLLGISSTLNPKVAIFAVQPASNPTIASHYDSDYIPETASITDSLTARSLPLKNRILKAISASGGGGVVVSDTDAKKYFDLLHSHQIPASAEGALAMAGYYKIKSNPRVGRYPVILITGIFRV